MPDERSPRILVIRRDNIGDLVCTLPLFRALRKQLPDANLVALVTQYNAAVLARNQDLDAVFSYTKAKHRARSDSLLEVYVRRLKVLAELRRMRFDWVLLPGGRQASSLRMARWVRPARVLMREGIDAVAGAHEVEQCCHLLARMGLRHETPPARVTADRAEATSIRESMLRAWGDGVQRVVGMHISARKAPQRWPAERFAVLARRLYETRGAHVLLLWAPGPSDNPLHPGDDEKTSGIRAALPDVPVLGVRTERLEQLIAALEQCDSLICSDGGAMHIAAALGKPIVCLFGNSAADRWHPWKVRYELLQAASLDVKDISVDEVLAAHARLPVFDASRKK